MTQDKTAQQERGAAKSTFKNFNYWFAIILSFVWLPLDITISSMFLCTALIIYTIQSGKHWEDEG